MIIGRLGPVGRRLPPRAGPIMVGVASKTDGTNPTIPMHAAGHLLVGASANNNTHSSIEPALPSPWAREDGALGGTNRAAAIYSMIASSAAETGVWAGGANIPRVAWSFGLADVDVADAFEAASSTTLNIPALSGMAAGCFVGVMIMSRAAQTNIAATVGAALAGLGLAPRLVRNALPACWVGDTGDVRLSSFAPAAITLDTATQGHVGVVFSIKAAP